MPIAALVPHYTAEEVRRFPDDRLRYEVIRDYWIVDIDQRQVERWRPGDAAPEILTERLAWQGAPGIPAFALDLPAPFAANA
jgi:Uma2 family endonuclease